jgi:hypothetical protein
MHKEVFEIPRCPKPGQRLLLEEPVYEDERIRSGWLIAEDGRYRYQVWDFIPRFFPESNYADNFGMQWNRFRQTQLGIYSGHSITSDRFWNATQWQAEDMAGQWVLDCGCVQDDLWKLH